MLQSTVSANTAVATSPTQCGTCTFKLRCLPALLGGEDLGTFERAVSRQRRPLHAGEVLARQGDTVQALYTLRVGALKAVIQTPDGNERVAGFRFPGTVIGLAEPELSYWARTFIALEDSWICRIPLTSVASDGVRRQLVSLISQRLRREYDWRLTLASMTVVGRLASFFLALSEYQQERGLAADHFTLPMTYSDIASYLGVRHESVCRNLTELSRRRVIEHQGRRFVIPNLDALRRISEQGAVGR